ncbi:MAG: hypothetical protein AB7L91_06400 [Dehalococcoidia bacterium]
MTVLTLRESERVARIEHPCAWCSDPIVPGENYRDYAIAYDGRVHSYREHVECALAEDLARAELYLQDDEPTCDLVDLDGGGHDRGRRCVDCGAEFVTTGPVPA